MPEGPVVNTNLGPAPIASSNPIGQAGGVVGLMNDLAEMKNRQNQAALFTQQMSARQKLGEDLATWAGMGLSPEEQISRASHQSYAPFVTPEIANFRTSNLAGVQVQETQQRLNETKQKMFNAGLGPLAQALQLTGGDPTKFPTAFKMATAGLDPETVKGLAPANKAMQDFLTVGLPADKAAAHAEVQNRLRALGASIGGLDLDKLYAMSDGIKPQVVEGTDAEGRPTKVLISGGGATPLNTTPIIAGPTASESAFMKQRGEQAAGPTNVVVPNVPTPSGAMQTQLLNGSVATTLGQGLTPTQMKYAEIRGGDMAHYQEGLDDRVKMGQTIMQTIEPAWQAMQDMKKSGQTPGGLQTARMAIAQLAQGLGADPEVVDKISKLGDTQEFSKLMVNTTMSQISQQLPAMSKMAVSEYNSFTKNNPNLDTDPRAIEKIFKFWTKMQETNKTEQSELNEFLDKGGNISKWPAKWQEIAKEKGLVSSNPTGGGALGVGEHREVEPGVTIRRVK